MHDASAVTVAHIVSQVQWRQAFVAVFVTALRQVIQRVAEHLAAQGLAFGGRQHRASQVEALQALIDQIGTQQQHAIGCIHQRVLQLGVGIECLVGGDGPGGGGPDNCKSLLAGGQGAQAEGLSQTGGVVGLKGHVQRVTLFVGVFDFKFGQGGSAVKTPVHRLQAAVHKTAFDHALESTDFSGLVGGIHSLVRAFPITQYTQALEVFTLLVNLFSSVSAALGLHVVTGEVSTMQFLDRVFDRQAMAVPAGDVLRVKTVQLLALDDHVFEDLV